MWKFGNNRLKSIHPPLDNIRKCHKLVTSCITIYWISLISILIREKLAYSLTETHHIPLENIYARTYKRPHTSCQDFPCSMLKNHSTTRDFSCLDLLEPHTLCQDFPCLSNWSLTLLAKTSTFYKASVLYDENDAITINIGHMINMNYGN